MRVEVDQSGKIGDTKVATVLAFSNGITHTILIPATVKRECVLWLRERGRKGTSMYVGLFSVALFLLLVKNIKSLKQIVIDIEYPGHEVPRGRRSHRHGRHVGEPERLRDRRGSSRGRRCRIAG